MTESEIKDAFYQIHHSFGEDSTLGVTAALNLEAEFAAQAQQLAAVRAVAKLHEKGERDNEKLKEQLAEKERQVVELEKYIAYHKSHHTARYVVEQDQRIQVLEAALGSLLHRFEIVYQDRARLLADFPGYNQIAFKDWPDIQQAMQLLPPAQSEAPTSQWSDRARRVGCPCDAPDGFKCSFSNPAVAANWPCACVCHLKPEAPRDGI